MKIETLINNYNYDQYSLKLSENAGEKGAFPEIEEINGILKAYKNNKYCGTVYEKNSINLWKNIKDEKALTLLNGDRIYILIPNKWIIIRQNIDIIYEHRGIRNFIEKEIEELERFYLNVIKDKNNNLYLIIDGYTYGIKIKGNKIYIEKKLNFSPKGKSYIFEIDKSYIQFLDYSSLDTSMVNSGQGTEGTLEFYLSENKKSRFFELWNYYYELELEELKKIKEETKEIKYRYYSIERGHIRFYLDNLNDSSVNLSNWQEYINCGVSASLRKKDIPVGTLRNIKEDYIEVECLDDSIQNKIVKKDGRLKFNFRGNEVSLARRETAYEKIVDNRANLKGLKDIIVGEYDFKDIYYNYKFFDFIKGSQKAEEKQSQSIEGAINTPDIFLIQGPPGTGKTTVIRKIISEILRLDKNAKVVVTSHQNTAVDNIIDGMGKNNVAAYRYFGSKAGESDIVVKDFVNSVVANIDKNLLSEEFKRREYNIDCLKSNFNSISAEQKIFTEEYIGKLKEIKRLYIDINSFEDELVFRLDQEIINNTKTKNVIDNDYVEDLKLCIDKISSLEDFDEIIEVSEKIQKIARDCNDSILMKLSREFEDTLDNIEECDLEDIINVTSNFIERLKILQENDNEIFIIEKNKKFIDEIRESIYKSIGKTQGDKGIGTLLEWKKELINSPFKLEEVFKKYSEVNATTCQKSVSKGFFDMREYNIYDYVIIDEAARANPLDLFIPMCLGKKIILVGDHMQLPHLIESKIDDRLKQNEDITKYEYEKYIKKSLFGSLFETLPPDRKVMLNKQYRMNIEIGDLVSHLFYDDNLQTGTDIKNDTEIFTGKSLVTVNVDGKEEKEQNEEEALKIVELLKNFDEKGKHDIGVITFYKKQAILIETMVKKANFINLDIKIDTVDSFQGMENDIIMLSTVNTHRIGFTSNINRLNVALSRAKKLLIIVSKVENMKKNKLYNEIFDRSYII